MKTPLITCYILTYNNFNYIFEAIQSVLNQDYPNIEIGIFDDGSNCFPRKEILDYITKHKKENIKEVIVFSNEKNMGTVRNLNNMIRMTHGRYLLGIGSDDKFISGDVCTKVVKFFVEKRANIVTSYREIVDETGKIVKHSPSKRFVRIFKDANPREQYKMIACGAPIAGAATFFSRDIFERYSGYDESYYLQEDGPFFLRATRNKEKIYFASIITYQYRLGNGVSSGENNNPILVQDVKLMFEKEIMPYMNDFNLYEKRRIKYELERIKYPKKISIVCKIKLVLKYLDVIIHRVRFSR